MKQIFIETEGAKKLEELYLSTSQKIGTTGISLISTLYKSEFIDSYDVSYCQKMLEMLASDLRADSQDISWRRKIMERANSSIDLENILGMATSQKFAHLSNKELLQQLKDAAILPYNSIPNLSYFASAKRAGEDFETQMPKEEFEELLQELARRSIGNPDFSIYDLGEKKLNSIFWRLYIDIFNADNQEYEEIKSRQLFPLGLAMINDEKSFSNYFLQPDSSANVNHRLVLLGMLSTTTNLTTSLLSNTGVFLANKNNQLAIKATQEESLLQRKRNRELTELTKNIFSGIEKDSDAYLGFFTHPGLADIHIEGGLMRDLGVDFKDFFQGGIAHLETASAESYKVRQEIADSFPSLGKFMYQNYGELSKNDQYEVAAARLLSLFIPEMTPMATQSTILMLSPILKNEKAMVIFSGSVAMHTIFHLRQALKVEFDEHLSYEKKQRLISAHTNAVSQTYNHLFYALALGGKKQQKSAFSFFETLRVASKFGLGVLSLTPVGAPVITTATIVVGTKFFATDSVNQHIIDSAKKQAQRGLTPVELFSRQIVNKQYATAGGRYPEPTWFEIELASQILELNPELRKDLTIGKWFDGEKLLPPNSVAKAGENISVSNETAISNVKEFLKGLEENENSTQAASFSRWFAKTISTQPPTDFSSTFIHFQNKFGDDIMLDALGIEVVDIRNIAEEAKATADRALSQAVKNARSIDGDVRGRTTNRATTQTRTGP